MSVESKAELIMAIEDYECEKRKRWDRGVDYSASDAKSEEKILLRLIAEPKSKSGFIGVDAVRKMSQILEQEKYNKGVLIGKRFSEAAKEEMMRNDIQMISENLTPQFTPQKLYLRIQNYIDNLCEGKCGKVPEKQSDCEGYSEGTYSCKIRLISDDASFHFERGWSTLLKNDLKRLLRICRHIPNK
ncbi:MAG: restriction endonuclease [Candidatus Bathyarchaeota archaeon]|nr:MAG: restriction endonuclease [Candidatus Bathyarchaeota archaeon]